VLHCGCFACWIKLIEGRVVFCLPFPMLHNLHLKWSQKGGLLVIFGLGLITMSVSTARFIELDVSHMYIPGCKYHQVLSCHIAMHLTDGLLDVWSMAEMTVAIMVVSMPALKPLIWRADKSDRACPSWSQGNKTKHARWWRCKSSLSLGKRSGSDASSSPVTMLEV